MIKFRWKIPNKPLYKEPLARQYFQANKMLIFGRIMPIMQAGVVSSAPVGATGLLRKSFVITYGGKAKLTSELEYAAAVNDGRRAAPVALSAKEGIIKWIRLSLRGKMFFDALKTKYPKITHEQAAFILMRSKAKKRTPGQRFFEHGLRSVNDVVEQTYAKILAQIAREIA